MEAKESGARERIAPGKSSEKPGLTGDQKQRKPRVFTAAQYHELQQQFLIFSYLLTGLEIPSDLMASLWNAASTSVVSACTGIYNYCPAFGGFDFWALNNEGNMVGSQPWRCQTTDGEHWRCSNEIIPNQNFCKYHIDQTGWEGLENKHSDHHFTTNLSASSSSFIPIINIWNSPPTFIHADEGKAVYAGGTFSYSSGAIEFDHTRSLTYEEMQRLWPADTDVHPSLRNITWDTYHRTLLNAQAMNELLQLPLPSGAPFVCVGCGQDYPSIEPNLSVVLPRGSPTPKNNKRKRLVIDISSSSSDRDIDLNIPDDASS